MERMNILAIERTINFWGVQNGGCVGRNLNLNFIKLAAPDKFILFQLIRLYAWLSQTN